MILEKKNKTRISLSVLFIPRTPPLEEKKDQGQYLSNYAPTPPLTQYQPKLVIGWLLLS